MKLEITRQWLEDTLARGGPDDVSAGFGAMTTASTGGGESLTYEKVKASCDALVAVGLGSEVASVPGFNEPYRPRFDVLYGLGPVGVPSMIRDTFLGVKVTQSHAAVTFEPARRHRRSKSQTAAGHRRVQKKWTKRFGTTAKPCAYRLADGSLVVHPTIYEAMRRAAR